MPSISHESLVDLFRDCPALALELLHHATKTKIPPGITARVTSAEFTDLDAAEYRSDVVVVRLDGANDEAKEAIIVEVQLDRDPGKRYSWPMYLTGVRARLRCQTTVLVVAIDDGIAAWCAKPIPLGRGGSVVCPVVVGPRQLPRVVDFAKACQFPELAVLSAAAHGSEEDSAEIAVAALSACYALDSPRSTRYADFVWASLSEAARRALENLMNERNYEYQSEFAKRYVAEGVAEGITLGQRKVLLAQLTQRFGDIPDPIRERIERAQAEEIERWTQRIIPAATLADVFDA